jgi:alpha-L-fucosidase
MKLEALFAALLTGTFALASFASCSQTPPPEPFGAVPTAEQMEWQKMEYYMFVHFGPNTFTDVEWGDGKEDPQVFNPTDLDCRQWAATARAAGMQGIVITAKHHDGFCLWPSKHSTHTVRESAWKDGKGDLLRELSDACREYGIRFGVYLSPWDQNHPSYGTPEYNQVFANTLDEVLSGYGPVFEQWFDGANGHANSGVKLPPYDWPMFHEVVYRNQPQAIIFSDIGPGARWMGNERGVAGETNWSTINVEGFTPGLGAPSGEILSSGQQGGQAWIPAETDVSIRPGWFYSPATDSLVKSTEKLMDIWYTSVGRNSNLLLNVPPDRRGRIHPADSIRLMEFRAAREEAFAEDLAAGAVAKASASRGVSSKYAAANVLDGDYDTYWTTDDGVTAATLEIDLGAAKTFNRLMLAEYIPLGQRVASFSVEYADAATGDWIPLIGATTIGYKRILRFPAVTSPKLRIGFTSLAAPVISTAAVYNSPEPRSQSHFAQ